MDSGSLNLNIDTIIVCIKEGIDRVNELFGTDITVELDENAYINEMNATIGDTDNVDGVIDREEDIIEDKVEEDEEGVQE